MRKLQNFDANCKINNPKASLQPSYIIEIENYSIAERSWRTTELHFFLKTYCSPNA